MAKAKEAAEKPKKPTPKAEAPAAGTVSLEVAAKLVMVSPRRIQQLVREGYIPAASRGRYQTVGVVQGYIRSLTDEKKAVSRREGENRVRDARALEIEQRIAERGGRLIDVDEHHAIVAELVGMVREEFGSLSGQLTRDPERKRTYEDKIDGIFGRLADRCEKRSAELSKGGEASSPDDEDDA